MWYWLAAWTIVCKCAVYSIHLDVDQPERSCGSYEKFHTTESIMLRNLKNSVSYSFTLFSISSIPESSFCQRFFESEVQYRLDRLFLHFSAMPSHLSLKLRQNSTCDNSSCMCEVWISCLNHSLTSTKKPSGLKVLFLFSLKFLKRTKIKMRFRQFKMSN